VDILRIDIIPPALPAAAHARAQASSHSLRSLQPACRWARGQMPGVTLHHTSIAACSTHGVHDEALTMIFDDDF
jgi:hypothetical protein